MQQINFYQAEFKPQVVVLNAFQMLLIALAFTVLIFIISLFSSHGLDDERAALTLQQNQFNTTKQQSNALQQDILKYSELSLLEAKLANLQKQLKQQDAILAHLSNDNLAKQHGFSPILKSLSEQHIKQVWLTNFSLRQGGQSITIQGSSSRSELIPEYIDSLAKSTTFNGQQFSVFQMSSPDSSTESYDFELHAQGNE